MDFDLGSDKQFKRISASFGIATFPDQSATMEGLLEKVDKALYQSKHAGRNRVTVYGDKPSKPDLDEDFDVEVIDTGKLG